MRQFGALLRGAALRPVLVIWGFGYLLVDVFVYLMGRMPPGVSTLASIPLFVLGVTYTLLLERLRQRLRTGPVMLRWIALGGAVLAATAAHSLFDLYYFKWLAIALVPDWQRWAMDVTPERIFTVGLLYLWTFCLALTMLWAARVGSAAERASARATILKAAKQRAEATALRLQLNPHFLFNTLNSISSLVTLDRKTEAMAMIDQLADFLRASLDTDPTADVPLAQELDVIDAYLAIEGARFGERLEVEVAAPDALLDAMVPNFILQPLVENAIKHGVSARRGITQLRIGASTEEGDLVLSVVNRAADGKQLQPSTPARPSTGIGIANIRQRLAMTYGGRARLDAAPLPDGYGATIRLPLSREELAHAAE